MTLQEEITTEWDLYHDYTTSQVGLHDLLRGWRAVLDTYSREADRYRYRCKSNTELLLYRFASTYDDDASSQTQLNEWILNQRPD